MVVIQLLTSCTGFPKLKAIWCKYKHYAQSLAYALTGLDKLMKEDAMKRRQSTQIDYLDSDIFSPEKTDMQKEFDIDNSNYNLTNSIEL